MPSGEETLGTWIVVVCAAEEAPLSCRWLEELEESPLSFLSFDLASRPPAPSAPDIFSFLLPIARASGGVCASVRA